MTQLIRTHRQYLWRVFCRLRQRRPAENTHNTLLYNAMQNTDRKMAANLGQTNIRSCWMINYLLCVILNNNK